MGAVAASSRGPTWLGPALPQGRAPSKAQVPVVWAGCGQHLWNGVQGTASWELQIKPLCFICSQFGLTEQKDNRKKWSQSLSNDFHSCFLGKALLSPWTLDQGARGAAADEASTELGFQTPSTEHESKCHLSRLPCAKDMQVCEQRGSRGQLEEGGDFTTGTPTCTCRC